ncbi:EKC/KEOPS complex subunit LAGE3 [Thomomys bottae]
MLPIYVLAIVGVVAEGTSCPLIEGSDPGVNLYSSVDHLYQKLQAVQKTPVESEYTSLPQPQQRRDCACAIGAERVELREGSVASASESVARAGAVGVEGGAAANTQTPDATSRDAAGGADGLCGQHSSCRPVGDSGLVEVMSCGAKRAACVLQDPDSGTDAAGRAERPAVQSHILYPTTLSVPFPTPLEAEIAHGALAPDAEPHQGALGKELTVSGTTLAIRWTAADSRLLRVSILSFLEQLSLVIQTMRRFGPPVSR